VTELNDRLLNDRRTAAPDDRPAMLLCRSDGLGDGILSLGLLRGLRAGLPDWRLILAVVPGQVALFRECPWVDDVIPSAKIRDSNGLRGNALDLIREQVAALKTVLGDRAPQVAVDLSMWPHPQDSTSAFVHASGAQLTIAAVDDWVDDRMHGWLDRGHDVVCRVPLGHEVDRYRAVAATLGVEATEPRWWDLSEHVAPALAAVERSPAWRDAPKMILGVGATDSFRRWRPERFAAVARRAIEHGMGVVVLGGPDAIEEGDAIRGIAGPGVLNTAGRLSLVQSAALLTPNDVYVGNDTGTMHLAAAAGCACVEISPHPLDGDPGVGTSPVRFAPHGVPAVILRPSTGIGPCNRQCTGRAPHCIDIITVDDVWGAFCDLTPRATQPPYPLTAPLQLPVQQQRSLIPTA
jgi:ADP-heptose:LPS heptosyltransferase